jgi:hypothetical protein
MEGYWRPFIIFGIDSAGVIPPRYRQVMKMI